MPDKKITELPILTEATASGSDVIPVVDVSEALTSKISLAELRLYIRQGLTKADLGLSNVDNTADLDKPISTATQAALDGKQGALPAGTDGYVLSLASGVPIWISSPTGIPPGGTEGQALVKTSGADGAVGWATVEPRITVSTTQVITSSDMVVIDNAKSRQRIKIKGDLGTAYSSLPAGAIDGQELYLQGVSDDEPVILEAWSTADLGGALSITFTKNVLKYFIWDHGQSLWVMVGG